MLLDLIDSHISEQAIITKNRWFKINHQDFHTVFDNIYKDMSVIDRTLARRADSTPVLSKRFVGRFRDIESAEETEQLLHEAYNTRRLDSFTEHSWASCVVRRAHILQQNSPILTLMHRTSNPYHLSLEVNDLPKEFYERMHKTLKDLPHYHIQPQ